MESMVSPLFWSGKKVLITGHTGFKGSWLTLWLLRLGADIEAISLPNEHPDAHYHATNIKNHISEHLTDIRYGPELKEIIAASQAEIVFHLAAQPLVNSSYGDPESTITTNVIGTLNLLEAVRQSATIKTVLVITTDKVYLNNEIKGYAFKEEDPLGGSDPYSASKAMTELLCSSYRESFFRKKDIVLATARAGNVIGGGDWSADRLVPDYFRAVAQQQRFTVRYPDAVRPWQHVLESLRGYLLYAEYLTANRDNYEATLNFGPDGSNTITVSELLERLSVIDRQAGFSQQRGNPANKEATNLSLNSDKAKLTLNWAPALTIDLTLSLTSEWYRASDEKKDMLSFSLEQVSEYERWIVSTDRVTTDETV